MFSQEIETVNVLKETTINITRELVTNYGIIMAHSFALTFISKRQWGAKNNKNKNKNTKMASEK